MTAQHTYQIQLELSQGDVSCSSHRDLAKKGHTHKNTSFLGNHHHGLLVCDNLMYPFDRLLTKTRSVTLKKVVLHCLSGIKFLPVQTTEPNPVSEKKLDMHNSCCKLNNLLLKPADVFRSPMTALTCRKRKSQELIVFDAW